jgi:hypothetical protein
MKLISLTAHASQHSTRSSIGPFVMLTGKTLFDWLMCWSCLLSGRFLSQEYNIFIMRIVHYTNVFLIFNSSKYDFIYRRFIFKFRIIQTTFTVDIYEKFKFLILYGFCFLQFWRNGHIFVFVDEDFCDCCIFEFIFSTHRKKILHTSSSNTSSTSSLDLNHARSTFSCIDRIAPTM